MDDKYRPHDVMDKVMRKLGIPSRPSRYDEDRIQFTHDGLLNFTRMVIEKVTAHEWKNKKWSFDNGDGTMSIRHGSEFSSRAELDRALNASDSRFRESLLRPVRESAKVNLKPMPKLKQFKISEVQKQAFDKISMGMLGVNLDNDVDWSVASTVFNVAQGSRAVVHGPAIPQVDLLGIISESTADVKKLA